MARRRILTETVIKKYCDARRIGASQELSALYARVSDGSIVIWLDKGRALREKILAGEIIPQEDRIYIRFLEEVEEADGDAGISWQQVVDKTAQLDATWAWRMLRQRFPNGYDDPANAKTANYNYNFNLSDLTDEQLQRIANGEDPISVIAASRKS